MRASGSERTKCRNDNVNEGLKLTKQKAFTMNLSYKRVVFQSGKYYLNLELHYKLKLF